MFKFFFNFVFGFYYMWTISPVITLIELPLSLCAALISKLSGNKFKELSKENRKKNTLLWKTLQQHVKSSKEIHVYSLEEEKKSEFDVASCSMRTNMKSTARYSFKVSLLNNLSFVMIIAVVLLIGFYLVDNYGLSIGSLVAFFTYNSLLTTPFKNLIGILQEKQKMNVSLTRINQLLQNEQDNAYCCVAKDESIRLDINSPLALNSLSFSYDNYKNVVNHINLDSKTGGFYAFVGRTGCGKSTILKLIAGLYGGYTGVVSVLGNVMKDDNKLLLRKEMSFVFQDNYIFDGTIRENIIISNRDVDNESFERAVYCACVEDIVRKVPGGFDAIVGEEGMKLSGGERQRIGLARALILNRRILLLDEATSALDNDTESLVMNRIRENYPDLTCFVVAHRLTSIKKADCIFVMSEGRIVDYGNDEYLRKNSKCYMELVNAGN